MKLLYTYEDNAEAEKAANKIVGKYRIASERDSTETIYNLFGIPSWKNFYLLKLYNLEELKFLLTTRKSWSLIDQRRHQEILVLISMVAKNNELEIPLHWL